jgi:hypothetical protein
VSEGTDIGPGVVQHDVILKNSPGAACGRVR